MIVSIYVLSDPATGEVRYVGRTVRPLNARLSQHVSNAKAGSSRHCANWIRSLASRPAIALIASVPEGLSTYAEQDLIALLRAQGHDLCNLTDGGEGNRGWKASDETRARMSVSSMGIRHSPEARARMSAVQKGKKISPEALAKLSAVRKQSEAVRAHCRQLAEGQKGQKQAPEICAKKSVSHKTSAIAIEARAKLHASNVGRKRSAESRARTSAGVRAALARKHGQHQLELY